MREAGRGANRLQSEELPSYKIVKLRAVQLVVDEHQLLCG